MQTVSSYGVEVRKQNIPIRQTLGLYRSAVSYLTEIYEQVWEELEEIPDAKRRFNAAEHLVHTTKKNPACFDFDLRFPKMPSYLRRAAVQHALGSVSSYKTRMDLWTKPGEKTGMPKLVYENHAMPVFYRGVMYREGAEGKEEAYLKLYDGHDWKWFCVRLNHTDMEYLRKNWSGKKASAPILEKRHHKYFLRFSYTEEITLTKTPVKEQVICSVDLGINTDAVCTIMRADGTVLGRRFIDHPSEKDPDVSHSGTDPEVPEGTRLCAVTGKMGIYETPEYRAGKEDRRCDRKICRGKPCRCDRIRISGNAGEDIRKEKTETASVEKTGYPETL